MPGSTLLTATIAVLATASGTCLAAADEWVGQTFLTDYGKLRLDEVAEGRDYVYFAEAGQDRLAHLDKVLLDQPEVFIGAESPYKGAKPADLAAIAGAVRDSVASALQSRGYELVESPAPGAVYVRLAVTDLNIEKKKRRLLAYTPVGFVVSSGVRALQDFTDRYAIRDLALQVEVQDSMSSHDLLGAAVMQRGTSADTSRPLSFDALNALVAEYGERLACRLDNGHVTADRRIDCHDRSARQQRPRVLGP